MPHSFRGQPDADIPIIHLLHYCQILRGKKFGEASSNFPNVLDANSSGPAAQFAPGWTLAQQPDLQAPISGQFSWNNIHRFLPPLCFVENWLQ